MFVLGTVVVAILPSVRCLVTSLTSPHQMSVTLPHLQLCPSKMSPDINKCSLKAKLPVDWESFNEARQWWRFWRGNGTIYLGTCQPFCLAGMFETYFLSCTPQRFSTYYVTGNVLGMGNKLNKRGTDASLWCYGQWARVDYILLEIIMKVPISLPTGSCMA